MKDEQGVKDFFSSYAEDFDSIYGDGKPRNFFNRIADKLFRQAMYERYKRTINFLTNKQLTLVNWLKDNLILLREKKILTSKFPL